MSAKCPVTNATSAECPFTNAMFINTLFSHRRKFSRPFRVEISVIGKTRVTDLQEDFNSNSSRYLTNEMKEDVLSEEQMHAVDAMYKSIDALKADDIRMCNIMARYYCHIFSANVGVRIVD